MKALARSPRQRPTKPDRVAQQRVGVRDLKASLSGYLRRVSAGESIVITDRGRPVARLVPPDMPEGIARMIREGRLIWSGRKPDFSSIRPIKLNGPGKTISDLLIEERYED